MSLVFGPSTEQGRLCLQWGVPALTTVSAVLGTPPEDKELGHTFDCSLR